MAREWFLYYFQVVFFPSSCHVSPVTVFCSSASECLVWYSGLWPASSALFLATTTEVRDDRFPPGHHSYPSYRNVWLWLWVLRQSWLDLDLAGFIRYLFGESVILDNSYPTTNTEYVWAVRWWEVMFPDGLLCLLLERKNNTWLLLPEKQWECQEFWSRGRDCS